MIVLQEQATAKIRSFMDLIAWQQAHRLAVDVYRCTEKFPKEEIFGLTNQLRRAVVSITSNIAEGFSRQSSREKTQFYSVALGSLTEVQNQLFIARDVGYLSAQDFDNFAQHSIHVSKLLNGLIKKTKSFLTLNS